MNVFGLPYLWFRNIIRLLEKRPYSAFSLLLFCAFVGITRMLGEFFIGARAIRFIVPEVFGFTIFYWHLFFAYGLILFLLVPQPWRKSINVVLVGIFLGIVPPIVDFFAYDLGQIKYGYFWKFPSDWNWLIFNPAERFYFGETLVLWLTIALTTGYVAHKTRSWPRTILAALLSYGVVLTQGAMLPTLVKYVQSRNYLYGGHLYYMLGSAQILLAIVIYFILQPALTKRLFQRAHHALPFVVMSLLGAAYHGEVSWSAYWYAGLVFLTFLTALVQNDFHDAADDAAQGRTPYVDLEDVRFFTISSFMIAAGLLVVNSVVGALLILILVLSFLYSYPYYRAKLFFPSNLKIEGCWGLASFLIGYLGAFEYRMQGIPRWQLPIDQNYGMGLEAPGLGVIIAAALVFGGHSLLAVLKDYKDVDADRLAGVQTIYTLALRKGGDLRRTHRAVSGIAIACLLLPLPLLFSQQLLSIIWAVGGLLFLPLMIGIIGKTNDKRFFGYFLWITSAYLLYLFAALQMTSQPL